MSCPDEHHLLRALAEAGERLAAVTRPIDPTAEAPWQRLANELERIDEIRQKAHRSIHPRKADSSEHVDT